MPGAGPAARSAIASTPPQPIRTTRRRAPGSGFGRFVSRCMRLSVAHILLPLRVEHDGTVRTCRRSSCARHRNSCLWKQGRGQTGRSTCCTKVICGPVERGVRRRCRRGGPRRRASAFAAVDNGSVHDADSHRPRSRGSPADAQTEASTRPAAPVAADKCPVWKIGAAIPRHLHPIVGFI